MAVEAFFSRPKDYLVRIGKSDYTVAKQLTENGDPPDVVSYLLEPISGTSECRVMKVPFWPRKNETAEASIDPNNVKAQFKRKKEQAHDLAQITSIRRPVPSVPRIYEEEPFAVAKDGTEVPLKEYAIVREYVRGTILSNWMVAYEAIQPNPAKHFAGIREVDDWFRLARMLVNSLESIHNERLVHGDLRPRNIILEGLSLGELDVTKPEELRRLDPADIALARATVRLLDTEEDSPESFPSSGIESIGTFRRKYDSPQLLFEKKRKNGPFVARKSVAQWFAPTDIFSLGIILFTLACGEEARLGPFLSEELIAESNREGATCPIWFKIGSYQVPKTNRQLKAALLEAWVKSESCRLGVEKSKITEKQWTIGKEGIIRMSEVILACLRSHTDASMADLKSIDGIIDEFEPVSLRNHPSPNSTQRVAEISEPVYLKKALNQFLESSAPPLPRVVKDLIIQRGKRLIGPLDDLTSGDPHWFHRITGRGAMVDNMVNLLGQLSTGDKCRALLTPNFFFKENMGLIGRVTSSLQLAAIEGVAINWILLVNEEQWKNRDIAEVLQHQKSAAQFLRGLDQEKVKTYGLNYRVIDKTTYSRIFHDRLTGILVTTREPAENILVAPDYHGEGGGMSALRIWPRPKENRWKALGTAFEEFEKLMLPVTAYAR